MPLSANRQHRCPLCRHALTATEYERVLGIQHAKERELQAMRASIASEKAKLLAQAKADRDELKRERESLVKQKRSLKAEFGKRVSVAKFEAQNAEKRKSVATIKRLETNLKKAQIENEHLKNATNQSEVGRAWDGEMADFVKSVFGPLGDHVQKTSGSRKGDVIHNMRHDGEVVCPVIIENKTGLDITLKFLRQASEAKRVRKARYALLVSDGKTSRLRRRRQDRR